MASTGKRPKERRSDRAASKAKGKASGKEIEVKLRLSDRPGMLRRLAKLRAELLVDRVHEMNTLYDTAEGALAARGQLVRIRVERPAGNTASSRKKQKRGANVAQGQVGKGRALLTFKGPPESDLAGSAATSGAYKIREEHESPVEDPVEMAKVFAAMGLLPWFRYEKYRSTYGLPGIAGAKVELDETPIGDFLEIEGQQAAIDRAATRLGFRRSDYITKSYGALFMERQGVRAASGSEPRPSDRVPDMVF
jgi:adenylate cyclase, class 2